MDKDKIKKYTEANRASWNEVAPIHRKFREIDLVEEFKKPGFSVLDKYLTEKLKSIGISGSDVAQLCCNNGRETLSMINIGATTAIGFDISDEAVKEAGNLATVSGLSGSFVRTDVYDIGDEYQNRFDIVLITIGALYWLPDLSRFFKIAGSLLKAGGHIVIYDSHPATNMLAYPDDEEFDSYCPSKPVYSYFRKETWVCNDGIDYIGKTKYDGKTNYGWSYKFTDIINPMIENGFSIKELQEYPHDISAEFDFLGDNEIIPLSYMLIASK